MKLLLVHQLFTAPNQPGGTRHAELGQHLVRAGHQLSIVTSTLTYLSGDRASKKNRETMDGLDVLRSYTWKALSRNMVWRVISLLSFMVSAVWTGLRAGRVDLVMGTSPPIFQLGSAWILSVLRRCPLLLEIRDLWPEFAIDMGILKHPGLIWIARRWESFMYARADHIMVNSPAYRDYLIAKGVAPEKISFISNGVDPTMFNPQSSGKRFREKHNLADKLIVTYAGALGIANDIETILRAASRLQKTEHARRSDQREIHFLMVGDGTMRAQLEDQAREMQLANVTFAGSCPKSEMPEVLAASDVCVATLQNIAMFRTTYPNKVFDYMAAGRPIVLGIEGVIEDVVRRAECGLCVPPGDDAKLAEAVSELRDDKSAAKKMGNAGRTYVTEHFNRQQQAEQFVSLIEQCEQNCRCPRSFYARFGKRAFDLVAATIGLVLTSPVLLVVAVISRIKMGRPVFFRQKRPGHEGRLFVLKKFRTMSDTCDASGNLLPDERRLSGWGRFLRASSLDELPTLWNVVRGDLSLVGPRPLLVRYLDRYTPEQARRHDVTPGLTGWAQINGRNRLDWEEKFKLDVWYVDHLGFWLDIRILFATVWKVLRREGVTPDGEEIMPEFTGSCDLKNQ